MENLEEYKKLLRSHKLRITDCRLDVINYFLQENRTLFQNDLERQFPHYDRVTLYRTLISFLKYKIVHQIPNSTGVASYGLSNQNFTQMESNDNHTHFKCNYCGTIKCLKETAIPVVSLPVGYQIDKLNLIVDGICADCS